jgi:hypothetical protein
LNQAWSPLAPELLPGAALRTLSPQVNEDIAKN